MTDTLDGKLVCSKSLNCMRKDKTGQQGVVGPAGTDVQVRSRWVAPRSTHPRAGNVVDWGHKPFRLCEISTYCQNIKQNDETAKKLVFGCFWL
jgi:hypothetical protein